MNINKTLENKILTLVVEGRLDTNTSQELENQLGSLDDIEMLVFDFKELKYISSAGLRILLSCHKNMMASGGSMIVKNVNDDVKEVLDITGFTDILTIK